MSDAWGWFVAAVTILSMLACFWLIVFTNRQRKSAQEIKESEAHVWDEDVRELNNPLPMWWLWLFVLTLIWGAGYLLWYPGLVAFGGISGWSQEKQYEEQVAAAEARYAPIFARYGSMEIEALADDAEAVSIGQSLYANYCAQCHGSNAQGARGFPNLVDEEWQWGSTPAQIEHSILKGRQAVMPALGAAIGGEEELAQMIDYVQGLSDGQDTSSPAHSKYMTLCVACHGPQGTGNPALGAPNLANDIWLYGSSDAVIHETLVNGRNGVMPAHEEFLGADRSRILAAYIYGLSQ
jgi:cytochrome c oxidase cbb3-type subunit 3